MTVLQLKGSLSFSSVRMSSQNSGMFDLEPGGYDAEALIKEGVTKQAVEDCGGTLSVGQ